jgi:hypothetical protein
MVSKWWTRPIELGLPRSIENLRRIKSGGFSAFFRRIYLNADTSDLSTDATPEANCGIDRK